jgi:hypothetical protein
LRERLLVPLESASVPAPFSERFVSAHEPARSIESLAAKPPMSMFEPKPKGSARSNVPPLAE